MWFYKKKFILAFLCLAASAALTWKLFDMVESSKETVTLVQAADKIEHGTRVTAEMLRRAEVGSYGVDKRAIKSEADVCGKYAASDLYPGDVLLPEKFKSIGEIADNYVLKTRDTKKTAVSIQLKGVSAGLSGKLQIGDVVSAYIFEYDGGVGSTKGSVAIYPELQYLEVAAVTNSRAEDIRYEPDREINYEQMKTLGDAAIPATVIFIADEAQAVRLVEAENTGIVHLVFRGRGDYARELLDEYEGNNSSVDVAAGGEAE